MNPPLFTIPWPLPGRNRVKIAVRPHADGGGTRGLLSLAITKPVLQVGRECHRVRKPFGDELCGEVDARFRI